MKILLLTDRLGTGGAETHIGRLAHGLREAGNEVVLASGGGLTADALVGEGFRHIALPLPTHAPHRLAAAYWHLFLLLRREKFDIVHAHARTAALLLRWLPTFGTRRVVTVHAHFRTTPWLKRLSYWGERTVAVGEDLRAYVCDRYDLPATRVTVIPNGIDCTHFCADGHRKGGGAHILFASRLDADCSLGAELLAALTPRLCRRFEGLQITLVGGGSEYARLKALCDAANREIGRDALHLTGRVADTAPLLRNCDIFVGVSRAAIEAAASGCAVILCGNEGYGGILTAEDAGHAALSNFCARGCKLPDVGLLERDLVALLADPTLRRSLAEGGCKWVRAHCDERKMCRETVWLYQSLIPPKKHRRLLLGGYFGCGNMGDDSILQALAAAMPQDIELCALTAHPRTDRRRFGIRCSARRHPLSVAASLLRADAFVFGGGSLLQNITGERSLLYYLMLLRAARFFGCRTALCASGIGPLVGRTARARTLRELQRCDYIGLRDQASSDLLGEMGIASDRRFSGADAALLLPLPPEGRAASVCKESGIAPDVRFLCVVLRGGAACRARREELLQSVENLCRQFDLLPVFAVLDTRSDQADTNEAVRRLGAKQALLREGVDAVALFSRAEAVISMRLHALVFAALSGTAAVGVPADARDGKVAAFASAVGYAVAGEGEIAQKLLQVLKTPPKGSEIGKCVAKMQEKAKKDLANIAKMIYNSNNDSMGSREPFRKGTI